jgi:hypothetical protein
MEIGEGVKGLIGNAEKGRIGKEDVKRRLRDRMEGGERKANERRRRETSCLKTIWSYLSPYSGSQHVYSPPPLSYSR